MMVFLERVFRNILELGYTGAWIILAVLLMRCILKKAPKKYSYILWGIPAVRLLIPIPFAGIWGVVPFHNPLRISDMLAGGEVPGSISMLAGREVGWKAAVQAANSLRGNVEALLGNSGAGDVPVPAGSGITENVLGQLENGTLGNAMASIGNGSSQGMAATGGGFPSFMQAAAVIWVTGMLLYFGWNVFSYLKLQRRLKVSIKWKENIYFADGITHPFVLVGFPNKIYLPSSLGEDGVFYILRHEQAHVRRKDPLFNLIATFILGAYWFHPMVWVGVHYFRRDMEMSCDEAAVAGLDAKGVKAYVLDLLRFSVSREQWMQFPCAFGEKGVVKRAMNLKIKKARSKKALGLANAVVVTAAVILISNTQGVYQSEAMQESIGRSHGDMLSGIGGAIQTVGAAGISPFYKAVSEGTKEGMQENGSQGLEGAQEQHEAQKKQEPQSLQESMEQYFTELYSVLSDDTKNFSSEDFASTDGYMAWKNLEMRRYLGNALYGGIDNVRLQEVEIQSMTEANGRIEAWVSTGYLFRYGIYSSLPGKAKNENGYSLYKVSAIHTENGYKVLDILSDSGWQRRAKEVLIAEETLNIESNYEAVDAYFERMHAYQESLERYFMELYNVLMDDKKNFSYEDFASTNGYIIGRGLIASRYNAQVSHGGVSGVKLNEVDIESISETENGIEVMANVRFSKSYAMDPEDFMGEGDMLRISVIPDGDGYKVLDIDSDSKDMLMVKEHLAIGETSNIESNYAAVDEYFVGIERNVDELLQWMEEEQEK